MSAFPLPDDYHYNIVGAISRSPSLVDEDAAAASVTGLTGNLKSQQRRYNEYYNNPLIKQRQQKKESGGLHPLTLEILLTFETSDERAC